MSNTPTHFNSKKAVEHVAEMQAKGIVDATENHGTEIPGHLSAATDAAKETALLLLLFWAIFQNRSIPEIEILKSLLIFSFACLIWKSGRSAWLGWSRLERLHRIVSQEKWEIDHHRDQEREELCALYEAKGFHGRLLEDVIDTLMADDNRLLKVMVEEELGLTLESQEHPLKQSLGAACGVFISALLCLLGFYAFSYQGIFFIAMSIIGFASAFSSYCERNKIIPAILWNISIALFSFGTVYYLLEFVKSM